MLGNAFNFPLYPGDLSFGLGPQSYSFRGPVGCWRKRVSLYPWRYKGTAMYTVNSEIFARVLRNLALENKTLAKRWNHSAVH